MYTKTATLQSSVNYPYVSDSACNFNFPAVQCCEKRRSPSGAFSQFICGLLLQRGVIHSF